MNGTLWPTNGLGYSTTTYYSNSNCTGSPVLYEAVVSTNCSKQSVRPYACNAAPGTVSYNTVTTTVSCEFNLAQLVNSQSLNGVYIGTDMFNQTTCSKSSYSGRTTIHLASYDCLPGIFTRAAIDSAGTAALSYFTSNSCDIPSEIPVNWATATQMAAHSCVATPNRASDYHTFYKFTRSSSQTTNSTTNGTTIVTTDPPVSKTLGGGAIAGIVIGCLIAVTIAVGGFIWSRRMCRNSNSSAREPLIEATSAMVANTIHTIETSSTESRTITANESSDSGMWKDKTIAAWRVARDKVVVGKLISRGGYGEVYRGTFNGEDVAIKMLLPGTRRSSKHIEAFLAEVKMIANLEHTHIVRFIGVAWGSFNDLCVLSAFMVGGDLRDLLVSYVADHHALGFDFTKVTIALHVAHALTYLHSLAQPIIHRDLKSRNVLLSDNLDAKLTDFGVSREREDNTMTAGVGTSLWMAPEIMTGDRYGIEADLFSFGVLLSELDTHSLPYAHARDRPNGRMPDAAILQMVATGKLSAEFSSAALPSMVELGRSCVSLDPAVRPTAAEALFKLQTILREECWCASDRSMPC